MKKLLIVTLCIIGFIACLMGLTACSSETYYGTYYEYYLNDTPSGSFSITRKSVNIAGTEYTYTYSDNTITLSNGTIFCFAEENQVAYIPYLKAPFQEHITVRNGYFNAQFTVYENYQLSAMYNFYKNGTFRVIYVQSTRTITGTYYLKNGVLSMVNKSETGPSGLKTLNKLYFWYIDESYNIYSNALVKDYTKFQKTDDEKPNANDNGENPNNEPSNGNNENPNNESPNGNGGNLDNEPPNDSGENPDNEKPPVYEPHTLTYNFNYGDVSTITQQVTKNDKVNLILPSRDGYKFLGWYYYGDKIDSGIWQFDSDVTLFAWWEVIDYSITYNTDDGALPDNCLKSFAANSSSLPYALPVPIKQGFNFVGWYETENFSGEQITTIPKNSLQDYVLYAKYSDEDILEYELSFDETYYSVVGFKGNPQYVTVPETKDGLPVKEIATRAFENSNNLINIILPDSITKIGSLAFLNSGLTSIIIPDSVTSIGGGVFAGCSSLTEITLSDCVTSIGEGAFNGCSSLKSITIPDSVTAIGGWAFYECYSLTSITIPDGVTYIYWCAFYRCYSLTSVTIPDSVTGIDERAFEGCSNLASVTIGDSVTTIGTWAFYNCSSLTSVTIPDSVTHIGSNAFPDKLYKRYSGCYYLPTKNSDYGFLYKVIATDITNAKIHYDCKAINSEAFRSCDSLTSIIIPDSITSIGYYAFFGCSSLTSVTIGSGVTAIGRDAFYSCSSLTSVYYTGDIAGWCNISFGGTDANPLNYAHYLYIDNKLVTELIIPDTVTEIKTFAFYYCTSITSVLIPNSVTSIGERAFYGCSNLKIVFYEGDLESWRNITTGEYAIAMTSGYIYYYSATEPADYGYYWHYDTDGKTPVVWQKQY